VSEVVRNWTTGTAKTEFGANGVRERCLTKLRLGRHTGPQQQGGGNNMSWKNHKKHACENRRVGVPARAYGPRE